MSARRAWSEERLRRCFKDLDSRLKALASRSTDEKAAAFLKRAASEDTRVQSEISRGSQQTHRGAALGSSFVCARAAAQPAGADLAVMNARRAPSVANRDP